MAGHSFTEPPPKPPKAKRTHADNQFKQPSPHKPKAAKVKAQNTPEWFLLQASKKLEGLLQQVRPHYDRDHPMRILLEHQLAEIKRLTGSLQAAERAQIVLDSPNVIWEDAPDIQLPPITEEVFRDRPSISDLICREIPEDLKEFHHG